MQPKEYEDPEKSRTNNNEDLFLNKSIHHEQEHIHSLIKFFFNREKDILIVQNAIRVVKILNTEKQVVLIQTAAKSQEPLVFSTRNLKKGIYTAEVANRRFTFIKQ